MSTMIWELNEGGVQSVCCYSLDPQQALVCYYMQTEKNQWNTWDYPKTLSFIFPLSRVHGFYYTKQNGTIVYATEEKRDAG